jgi:hypothetical protein
MKRTLHGVLVLSALLLLNGTSAYAQVDRAIVSGIIRDSGGGILPGATVVVTSLATNVESRQQTSDVGSYQVGNLIPGKYRVDVELSGFKKSSQVVTLEVSQRVRLDVELTVGSFAETVTVAESPQLLNTNDATLGAVIPQTQVANLPLAIRNWDDLLALVPGVQGDRSTEQGGGTWTSFDDADNIRGLRSLRGDAHLCAGMFLRSVVRVGPERAPINRQTDGSPRSEAGGGRRRSPLQELTRRAATSHRA